MSDIDLALTYEAREELETLVSADDSDELIVAPAWLAAGSIQKVDGTMNLEPRWGIGLYRRSSAEFDSDEIRNIDGIPFVFLQGSISEDLDGATLDYKDGEWVVVNTKSA